MIIAIAWLLVFCLIMLGGMDYLWWALSHSQVKAGFEKEIGTDQPDQLFKWLFGLIAPAGAFMMVIFIVISLFGYAWYGLKEFDAWSYRIGKRING